MQGRPKQDNSHSLQKGLLCLHLIPIASRFCRVLVHFLCMDTWSRPCLAGCIAQVTDPTSGRTAKSVFNSGDGIDNRRPLGHLDLGSSLWERLAERLSMDWTVRGCWGNNGTVTTKLDIAFLRAVARIERQRYRFFSTSVVQRWRIVIT